MTIEDVANIITIPIQKNGVPATIQVINQTVADTASTAITNISNTAADAVITVSNTAADVAVNTTKAATVLLGMDFGNLDGKAVAIIGAGIAVAAAGIASAIGAGIVGSTGARESAEDPKRFSQSLLFQALPQTQGIYGFLIAILIMLGAGVIGPAKEITLSQGLGALGAGLAVGLAAVSAIGQGLAASAGLGATARDKKMFGKSILFSVLPETQALYGFLVAILILVGFGLFGTAPVDIPIAAGWAAVGAGLAIGLAGISAIGQGIAAAGSIGAVLEKSKAFGKSVIFAVLPETQALYGFIIAILILIGFGILGTATTALSFGAALFTIAAGLSVGLAAVSAIGQGIAASSGVNAVASNDKSFGKSILFSVLPETQALYGFLIAILLLVGAGIIGAAKAGITTPIGVIAIGAGLAAGIAGISAIGQGIAASAGINAVSQKPKSFGKAILFSVLPETQALYGFLIAILLLVGGGILGTAKLGIEIHVGLIAIGAGLATGLAAISAVGQGIAASSGIATVAKDEKSFGKSILFSVLPETQALYGFLIAILLMVGGGLLGAIKSGLNISTGLIAIGAGLATGLAAVSAIGQGIAASSGINTVSKNPKSFGKSILFSVLPETQALYGFLIAILLMVGGGIVGATTTGLSSGIGLIAVGCGIAVGFAAVSAVGQGIAASAGINAVNENPKSFGKSILFSVLPETQALYGFLIAILLMVGGGLVGIVKQGIDLPIGLVAIGAAIATGIAGISAVGQGMAASSGIATVAKDEKSFGKSILFSVLPETQALYGFLIAILLMVGGGLLGVIKEGISIAIGFVAIGAGLAAGLAAVSAVGQGIAASSGINTVSRNPKSFGKSILFSVLPETQALYGFLIAVLLLVGGGIIGVINPNINLPVGLIAIGAGLATGLAAVSAVGQGMAAAAGAEAASEDPKSFGKSILFSVLPETQALYGFLIAILLVASGGILGAAKPGLTVPIGLVAVGAGVSIGVACLSALGQGIAASSGIGSILERKNIFGKSVLFSVLPETQALYGIIISILLLTGVGLLGTIKSGITITQGIGGIGIGIAMGLAAVSAVGQGIVSASSIGAAVRDQKSTGKSLVLSVIPETYAIFGLLISILLLIGLKFI
jgi:V/A-type H+-transporting ATPase subunit K